MADHERLDHAIEARTIELGISYVELADRAGISDVSIRNLRKGRANFRPRNLRKLEIALEWAAGSIAAVLAGGDPTNDGAATTAPPALSASDLIQMIAETEDELAHLNPRYESNRPLLTKHLEQRLADLRRQLDALSAQ